MKICLKSYSISSLLWLILSLLPSSIAVDNHTMVVDITENITLTTPDLIFNENSTSSSFEKDSKQEIKPLSDKKSRYDSNEINMTTTVISVDLNTTQLMQNKSKSHNRRSADRLYGYFSPKGKFYYCSEESKPKDKRKTVDESFLKCMYFDGQELRQKFNRPIQSNNGFKGVFGYFHSGKFTRCSRPERLDDHPNKSDVKYIPFDLNYDNNCGYFDNDPGTRFDYVPDTNQTASNNCNDADGSVISLFMMIVSYLTLLK